MAITFNSLVIAEYRLTQNHLVDVKCGAEESPSRKNHHLLSVNQFVIFLNNICLPYSWRSALASAAAPLPLLTPSIFYGAAMSMLCRLGRLQMERTDIFGRYFLVETSG